MNTKGLNIDEKLILLDLKYKMLIDGKKKKRIISSLNRKRDKLLLDTPSSRHHIFPQSKYFALPNNVVMISHDKHKKYHALFDDKDPYEILDLLVKYFWKNHINILNTYLKKYDHTH